MIACTAALAACAPRDATHSTPNAEVVDFTALKLAPESYRGRLVVVGGEVLHAKRLKDATRIEVLELPLTDGREPTFDRTTSRGRFMAYQREFLDPATIPPGTRLTIVGEVGETETHPLDETDYAYATVEIADIKVWPREPPYSRRAYPPPYYRPYWGYGWSPWRWGSPYFPYWW